MWRRRTACRPPSSRSCRLLLRATPDKVRLGLRAAALSCRGRVRRTCLRRGCCVARGAAALLCWGLWRVRLHTRLACSRGILPLVGLEGPGRGLRSQTPVKCSQKDIEQAFKCPCDTYAHARVRVCTEPVCVQQARLGHGSARRRWRAALWRLLAFRGAKASERRRKRPIKVIKANIVTTACSRPHELAQSDLSRTTHTHTPCPRHDQLLTQKPAAANTTHACLAWPAPSFAPLASARAPPPLSLAHAMPCCWVGCALWAPAH